MYDVLLIMAAVCVILVAMVMAWVVYTLSTVKKQMVYTDELNIVVDQLNSVTRAIHRAYKRNANNIDKHDTKLTSYEAKRKKLEEDLAAAVRSMGTMSTIQTQQNSAISQNEDLINSISGIVSNSPILENKAEDFVLTDNFNDMFEQKLGDSSSPFTIGASVINIGAAPSNPEESGAYLKYGDDAVMLGNDNGHIRITNSGIQYCDSTDACVDIPTSNS